jgi:hypothetical protein
MFNQGVLDFNPIWSLVHYRKLYSLPFVYYFSCAKHWIGSWVHDFICSQKEPVLFFLVTMFMLSWALSYTVLSSDKYTYKLHTMILAMYTRLYWVMRYDKTHLSLIQIPMWELRGCTKGGIVAMLLQTTMSTCSCSYYVLCWIKNSALRVGVATLFK